MYHVLQTRVLHVCYVWCGQSRCCAYSFQAEMLLSDGKSWFVCLSVWWLAMLGLVLGMLGGWWSAELLIVCTLQSDQTTPFTSSSRRSSSRKSSRLDVQFKPFTPLRTHMMHLTNGSVVTHMLGVACGMCEEAVVCGVISTLRSDQYSAKPSNSSISRMLHLT